MGLPGYLIDSWPEIESSLTYCWSKSLCTFMYSNQLELLDPLPKLQPLRENDRFIIKEAIRLGFRNIDLKRINECRMFLSATCMSELCTADGYKIREAIWNGKKITSSETLGGHEDKNLYHLNTGMPGKNLSLNGARIHHFTYHTPSVLGL